MPSYTITPAELPAEFRNIGNAMRKAIIQGHRQAAVRSIPLLHRATRDKGAMNTGEYLRAWKSENTDLGARVGNDRVYAPIIEEGRRRGSRRPPQDRIARWAQRKLKLSADEARAAAFAIASAIVRRGIAGRHIMGDLQPEFNRLAEAEVTKSMKAALNKRPRAAA